MSLIPRSRGRALLRFALAGVIVIALTASATAVAGLLQFKHIRDLISVTPAIKQAPVTIADPGEPQTLLLIGSDHRAGTPFSSANTDTMMLVHIDPNSSTINVLSVPRDLKVQLPQGGVLADGKLNSAYSIGGPGLLEKTLYTQVLPGLQINHIIDINFGGFEALVNAIGCVYTDVDHRYYHQTAPDAADNYSSIDIQPGYQKLCGNTALDFVRFRHSDTDIVRNARHQAFLRWAKDQFSTASLIASRDKLISIFGHHAETDSDLHSIDGLINLFNLVAFSAGHTVKQVPFPAILLPCNPQPNVQTPCFVTADPGAEHRAFESLMAVSHPQAGAPAATASGSGSGHGPSGTASGSGSAHGPGGTASGSGSAHRPGPGSNPAPPPADVSGDVGDGLSQAGALGRIGMPVYIPGVIANQSRYCTNDNCAIGPNPDSYPRAYQIQDQSGGNHVAYRLTLVLNPALGQYYGIQGTNWQNPPILNGPNETRMVGGKKLLLYFNGHKLTLVAWRTGGSVYWVSNTLTDDLSNEQMLAIAASLRPA